MTNEYEIADDSRENLIWTKEQLLAPLESGMEVPPHPMRLGDTERDYYRLGSAGVTVPRDQEDAEARPAWAPGAEAPDSQAPDTQAPDSQAPDSQAPDTQAPGGQEDSHPGGADQ